MNNLLGMLPLNLSLLILNAEMTRGLRQIKVLDIFEPSSTTFHPDGLFSIEAFGKVGDERRNRLYGYIDMGIEVLHPVVYKKLVDLRELYASIMAGTAYAVFNKETKDFDPCPPTEGRTGYSFFLEHLNELQPEKRESTSREFAIRLLNENRDKCLMRYLIVMPAGLRDFTISPEGKREEDEVNKIYREVLSIGNVMLGSAAMKDKSHLDNTRYRLQESVLSLYLYITNLLQGDSKLIQGHWTNRNVFNSTRNVITASVTKTKELFDELTVGPNDQIVGLYQFIRSIFPVFVNLLRGYSERVFPGPNTPARLVNKKSFLAEQIGSDADHYDEWVTQDGIEGLLNRFESESLRHEPIEISGAYFGLLYRDKTSVRFMQDINELPEGFSKEFVKPITYAELFYLAVFDYAKDACCLTTRYPVIALGGIYPAEVYLRTTTKTDSLSLLDVEWKKTGKKLNEFPRRDSPFFNSMSPSSVHLARAGADFDGDMMNYIVLLTSDARTEIKKTLRSRSYYVNLENTLNFSSANDISNLVCAELSS